MDNKTVLTVQEQKKEKRYLWLDFFKFLFFQVSGLSKIKYLFFLIAIGKPVDFIQQVFSHLVAEIVEDILFDVQVNHFASFRLQMPVMFLQASVPKTNLLMVSALAIPY